jgi:hypothetical protein
MKKFKIFWNDSSSRLQEITVLAADCFLAKNIDVQKYGIPKESIHGVVELD